jgi:hypothetical protein
MPTLRSSGVDVSFSYTNSPSSAEPKEASPEGLLYFYTTTILNQPTRLK